MMSCPLACSERVVNCVGLFKIQILKQHMAPRSQQRFPKVKTLQGMLKKKKSVIYQRVVGADYRIASF